MSTEIIYDASTGEAIERPSSYPVITEAQSAALDAQQAQQDANEQTIGQQIDAALANNANYLAISGPTNAQVVAQVKALTRQTNGLIRLLRRKLDAAS